MYCLDWEPKAQRQQQNKNYIKQKTAVLNCLDRCVVELNIDV